jgi:hypothetical protein
MPGNYVPNNTTTPEKTRMFNDVNSTNRSDYVPNNTTTPEKTRMFNDVNSTNRSDYVPNNTTTTPEKTRMFNDVNSTNRSVIVRPSNCYVWGGGCMVVLFICILGLTSRNTLPPTPNEDILSILKLSVARLMTVAINYWHKWEQTVNAITLIPCTQEGSTG